MKTSKTKFAAISAGMFLIIAAAAFYVYWKNYRGAWTAIAPPKEDIAELIGEAQKPPETLAHGENKTEFPLIVPAGFSISVFAQNLDNPRVLGIDPVGTLIVSIPKQGKILALPDNDKNGEADEVITVIEGLNNPHGLAFLPCPDDGGQKTQCPFVLYAAETDQVARYNYNPSTKKTSSKEKILDLPDGGRHVSRTILFKDGLLLTSVGSSCDTCQESDWRRATILHSQPDGSSFKHFATGLRNAVFMTIHPATDELWATEMGRDHLGDDLPPDEINIIQKGKDYGWPYCYGKQIHDTIFDNNQYIRDPCLDTQSSSIDIPAHSAPLGLAFFPHEGWPEEYWDDLLVAYHGSWNRITPTGYKIVRYTLNEQGDYEGEENFITGWLRDDNAALGRPVDIKILPNGVIYISDDNAGVIYKATYEK